MSQNTIPLKAHKKLFEDLRYDIKKNKFLILLSAPAILWFVLFAYVPLLGLIIAFQKFSPARGILGSEFIAFKNFEFFFKSEAFLRVTFNTLFLNALFIGFTMITSIIIALSLSEINTRLYKRVTQSVVILPHFISWTVVALLCEALFTVDRGLINRVLTSFGAEAVLFYQNAKIWPGVLTALRIWQGAGYGSIIYLATITGFDKEMFEAARIDGATRTQTIWHLTLPMLRPTAVILLLMSVGRIFNGDFGMIFAIIGNNTMLLPTTDVIDTYVYRQLMEASNIGMSSAIGLYQSVMGFIMVMGANALARKLDSDSALF
ncbi:sugar ABC transporter permease [Spirochaetia bacterium]|nr:sugar ABC transporter permease [Spirochaetia bacterium]